MVTRFEKFSYFITELSRLLHKIEADEMEALDLKGPHAIYIITLANYENGITAANLAQCCGKDKADVSRAIGMLMGKGLISKPADAKNNYRAPIFLTEEGMNAAKRLRHKVKAAVDFASRGVSDDDRAALYRSLEAINNNVRELSRIGLSQIMDNNKSDNDTV